MESFDNPLDHMAPQQGLPLQAPQIINTPPQIFGAYGPDGSPIPATLQGTIFDHDQAFGQDQAGGLDESSEAKRRRIARCTPLSDEFSWIGL
ncbi:MAG: hypothetical protein M1833_000575 [Piccolia ochrophora]|nr:MAG: hypothetical protein M1833_000575 [Piccolia ochrophora]